MKRSAPSIWHVAAVRTGRALLVGLLAAGAVLATPPPAQATSVIYHGPRSERAVALTFDDAYSASVVRRILGILARQHVRATFFPVSFAVRSSPATWRRVLREGHAIGDHTINHPALTALSGSALKRQLVQSQRMIRAATGQAVSPYLRPPYGLWDRDVVRAASAAGLRAVVMWDVDARDWEGWPAARLYRNATRGTNGSIVVMHALPATIRVLPRIIRFYRQRGFRFVTVPEMLDPLGSRPAARGRSAVASVCPASAGAGPLGRLSNAVGAASMTAQLYRSWIAQALLASSSLGPIGTAYLMLARVPVAFPTGPPACRPPWIDPAARGPTAMRAVDRQDRIQVAATPAIRERQPWAPAEPVAALDAPALPALPALDAAAPSCIHGVKAIPSSNPSGPSRWTMVCPHGSSRGGPSGL
jgi:peptidoglycan-N-acetylglucosamine deacetylase